MAKPTKRVSKRGYITSNYDRRTYTTTKNIMDDGYTTYSSDGSRYKTYKNLFDDGYTTWREVGPDIGSSILLFVFAVILLQICANFLTVKTYALIAGVLIAPKLSKFFEKHRISPLWSSSVLFSYLAFSLIRSFYNDVDVFLGTQRAGEALIAIVVLAMILLLGLFFTLMSMDFDFCNFTSAFVLLISVAWAYLDGFLYNSFTYGKHLYVIGFLILIATIDQIVILFRKRK